VLVVVTGIDGAGKSTLCRALAGRLSAGGLRAAVIKAELATNPAWLRYDPILSALEGKDATLSLDLRAGLVCLEAELYIREVERLLAEHDVVICDRHLESIRAYSIVRDMPTWRLDRMTGGARQAEVTILLDISVDNSLRRLAMLGEETDGMADYLGSMRAILREGSYTATIDAMHSPSDVLSRAQDAVMRAWGSPR
jgi:thymidylate kinase